jgi:hypothetical protein
LKNKAILSFRKPGFWYGHKDPHQAAQLAVPERQGQKLAEDEEPEGGAVLRVQEAAL